MKKGIILKLVSFVLITVLLCIPVFAKSRIRSLSFETDEMDMIIDDRIRIVYDDYKLPSGLYMGKVECDKDDDDGVFIFLKGNNKFLVYKYLLTGYRMKELKAAVPLDDPYPSAGKTYDDGNATVMAAAKYNKDRDSFEYIVSLYK